MPALRKRTKRAKAPCLGLGRVAAEAATHKTPLLQG